MSKVKVADNAEVLAQVYAAPARRWLAYGMLFALGALVIYVPLVHTKGFLTAAARRWLGWKRSSPSHAGPLRRNLPTGLR